MADEDLLFRGMMQEIVRLGARAIEGNIQENLNTAHDKRSKVKGKGL